MGTFFRVSVVGRNERLEGIGDIIGDGLQFLSARAQLIEKTLSTWREMRDETLGRCHWLAR